MMKKFLTVGLLLGMLAVSPVLCAETEAERFADRLPAETLLLLQVSDLKIMTNANPNSSMGKMMALPGFQKLSAQLTAGQDKLINGISTKTKQVGVDLKILLDRASKLDGSMQLAVVDVSEKSLSAAMRVTSSDPKKVRDLFQDLFRQSMALLPQHLKFREEKKTHERGEINVWTMDSPNFPPLYFFADDKEFLLTTDLPLLEALLSSDTDTALAKQTKLSGTSAYKDVEVALGKSDLRAVLFMGSLWKKIEKSISPSAQAAAVALNQYALQAIALSGVEKEGLMETKGFLLLPKAARTGIWSLLDQPAIKPESYRAVSPEAASLMAVALDKKKIKEMILNAAFQVQLAESSSKGNNAEEVRKRVAEEMKQQIGMMDEMVLQISGLPNLDALLDLFNGDTVVFASSSTFFPDMVLVQDTKDAKPLNLMMGKLTAFLEKESRGNFTLFHSAENGVDWYLLSGKFPLLQICAAVTEKNFVLASNLTALKTTVARLQGKEKGIDQTPFFKAALAKLPKGGSLFSFCDTRASVRDLLNLFYQFNLPGVACFWLKKEYDVTLNPIDFPSAEEIAGCLLPTAMTIYSDDKGIYLESVDVPLGK